MRMLGNGAWHRDRNDLIARLDELERNNEVLSGALAIVNTTVGSYSFEELIPKVLGALRTVMSADAAMFFIAERGDRVRLLAVDGVISEEAGLFTLPFGKGLAGEVARRREPVYSPDMTREAFGVSASMRDGFRSSYGVPLLVDGAVYGVLEILYRDVVEVTIERHQVLALTVDRVREALVAADRFRAERRTEELNASLGRLSTLLSQAQEAAQAIERFVGFVAEAAGCIVVLVREDGRWLRPSYSSGVPLRKTVAQPPLERSLEAMHASRIPEYFDVGSVLGEWARKNFGIAHGIVISVQSSGDHQGFMVCGRTTDHPLLDYQEYRFIRQAVSALCASLGAFYLRTVEKDIFDTLQNALSSEVRGLSMFTMEHVYRSATSAAEVGGDFFETWELPDGRAAVLLGDVSGHGVKVAVLTMLVKNVVGAYLSEGHASPSQVMSRLNRLLIESMRGSEFVSLVLLVVDPANGRCTYCCAGHPAPFIAREADGVEVLAGRSPVVGALDTVTFNESSFVLTEGDVLFLYTDGATEARDTTGRFFGEERLLKAFSRESKRGFTGIAGRMEAVVERHASGEISDDLAMLFLRYE